MSLVKAAREYLDFMTCGDGITWIDYRAESERLENNLREALEAAEQRVHSDVCPVSNGEHVWEPDGSAPHECCSLCATRR